MFERKPGATPTLDGLPRGQTAEARINSSMASVFATKEGEYVLNYLKSITINRVNGPNVTDAELRHLEGQRWLVALIQQRIETGKKEPKNG